MTDEPGERPGVCPYCGYRIRPDKEDFVSLDGYDFAHKECDDESDSDEPPRRGDSLMDFNEREKAIIEVAVQHFRTDCVTRGNFDAAQDATKVGEKVRQWRDDETIPDDEEDA